jgi:DNA-binding transcriptional ArsR family regulator
MAGMMTPPPDDAVFKALSDPTRREILSLLRERRRSVGEIASNFRVSRPAISKHIRLLRDAGLVVDRTAGTAGRVCELNAVPLRAVDDWLDAYKKHWSRGLARLKTLVEEDR